MSPYHSKPVKKLITGVTNNQLAVKVDEGGGNEHTYYTYATDSQEESTNIATWRPRLVNAGIYRLYAHIPQGCRLAAGSYASQLAHYRITYAGGVATYIVDQNTATEWVDLGLYPFEPGDAGAVTLDDMTGATFQRSPSPFLRCYQVGA